MKLIAALLPLLLSLNAFAGDPNLAMPSQNETQGQGACEGECYEQNTKESRNQLFQMRDLRGKINDNVVPATIAKIAKATKYPNGKVSPTCEGFASEKGWGPWGEFLNKELDPNEYPMMFKGTSDLADERICPNWDSLSTESKRGIWILVILSASQMESTCNPKAINRDATNGTAYGLTQLHLDEEDNSIGRCERGSARTANKSTKCMARNIEATMTASRALITKDNQHFAVFFPNAKGRAIFNAIKKYPGCH
jgi:hypothetical protein